MKNVLLVEDDVILRHVLSGQLSANGFTVSEAQNGEEALEILKLEKPDVILLDLILPGIDGFEVLKQIKGDILLKNIFVIVISNLGDDDAIKRAFNLGADDYFVKAQYPIKSIIEKLNAQFKKNGEKSNGAKEEKSEKKEEREEKTPKKEKEGKKSKPEEKPEEKKEKEEKPKEERSPKTEKTTRGRHLQID